MKAFVLAAGVGTRLRPLTNDIPKPMIPILGKPALHYTIELLRKNDFDEIFVNLHYRPQAIMRYFKDNPEYIPLNFSLEKKIMGTAGAIKKKENFLKETFVVMSGDGLTDINLKKAIEFHRKKKSLATIVLKEVDFRFEYGVALTDKNGEIKSFIEKPSWRDVFDSKVNTGIYVFEPEIFKFIPENKLFDFSRDLFPLLKKKNKPIFGYTTKDYWKDIGNISEYKSGVFDALDGKVKIDCGLRSKLSRYINSGAKIGGNVKIQRNCFIGTNVEIGENSIIKSYSVISDNVKIGANSSVEKTVIWGNSQIGGGVKLTNSIVCGALIPENVILFDSIVMESSG
jgi:mannose-1-phosphate guanylyltransferase/phosphomannomutase